MAAVPSLRLPDGSGLGGRDRSTVVSLSGLSWQAISDWDRPARGLSQISTGGTYPPFEIPDSFLRVS
jgi:hypothetical protein